MKKTSSRWPPRSRYGTGILGLLLCLLLAACDLLPLTPMPQVTRAPTLPPTNSPQPTHPLPSATATPGTTPSVTPTISTLVRSPTLVWFAPLPPLPQTGSRPFIGSKDFMDLFQPDAAWGGASRRVGVFKLYAEWVTEVATDAELEAVLQDLKTRRHALAVEIGPLEPSPDCGQGQRGYAGLRQGEEIAQRIRDAGAALDYISLDEPYYYGHLYQGYNACRLSSDQIAQSVGDFVRAMRAYFPEVKIGALEPLPPGVQPADYRPWLQAYRSEVGDPLAFFHLDVDYRRIDWPDLALELQESTRNENIPFGILYRGQGQLDQDWIDTAWQRAGVYEMLHGAAPPHVIFQSWEDLPDNVLPENEADTFTHLINRYFRKRSALQVALGEAAADGARKLSGSLIGADDSPIAQAPLQVNLQGYYQPTILNPPLVNSLEATTSEDGRFELSVQLLPNMGTILQAFYPGSDTTNAEGSTGFWPAYASLTSGNPARNIAFGAQATASNSFEGNRPPYAVDGDADTIWTAGDNPRHFLDITWSQPSTIHMIRLLVSQETKGWTTHWIWGKDIQGKLRLLEEIGGETADMDVIDFIPETPWENMLMIRIETVKSPSWVAWREVEIIGP